MTKPSAKTFDCVQMTRRIRDRLSAEIANMSYDELVQWLRSHQYSAPHLKELADKAVQRNGAADRANTQ